MGRRVLAAGIVATLFFIVHLFASSHPGDQAEPGGEAISPPRGSDRAPAAVIAAIDRSPTARAVKPQRSPGRTAVARLNRAGARLTRGTLLHLNGRSLALMAARAVPSSSYRPGMGPVLYEQAGFSIIAAGGVPRLRMGNVDRPVVMNAANNLLGVVTGTVMLRARDAHSARALAGAEKMQLLHYDPAIGVAYCRVRAGADLAEVARRLEAEVEVIYGLKVAR